MALISCPECGKEISDKAAACPNCGCPIAQPNPPVQPAAPPVSAAANKPAKAGMSATAKAGILIAVVAVIAIVVFVVVSNQRNAVDFNDLRTSISNEYCSISEDGKYMTVDTNPNNRDDYYSEVANDMVETINEKLGLPDVLYEKMAQTRALDGRQEEEYDGIKVSWTYHPNNGLEIIYEVVE